MFRRSSALVLGIRGLMLPGDECQHQKRCVFTQAGGERPKLERKKQRLYRIHEHKNIIVKESRQAERKAKVKVFVPNFGHDSKQFSLLHGAAFNGWTEVVERLVESGTDPEERTEKGLTAIHCAISHGHLDIVKILIRYGADWKAEDSIGRRPIHAAVEYGHREVLDFLLEKYLAEGDNSDLHKPTSQGKTTLHYAALRGNAEEFRLLVRHGANPDARTEAGWTPLHCAAQKGMPEVTSFLIHECHVDPMAVNANGWCALHFAADFGRSEVAKILFPVMTDRFIRHYSGGWSPLHVAAARGHASILRLFVENNPKETATVANDRGWTALHLATVYGCMECCTILCDSGVNLEATTLDGFTPLHTAIDADMAPVIKLLLDRGADPTRRTSQDKSMLQLAAHKSLDVLQLVLEVSNIEDRNTSGWTAVHTAAHWGSAESIKLLIRHGADLEAASPQNWTPIHMATDRCHPEALELLLQCAHHTINRQTEHGWAPLHQAAFRRSYECTHLLLHYGADPNVRNRPGLSALDLAARHEFDDIVELLVSYGAKHSTYSRKLLEQRSGGAAASSTASERTEKRSQLRGLQKIAQCHDVTFEVTQAMRPYVFFKARWEISDWLHICFDPVQALPHSLDSRIHVFDCFAEAARRLLPDDLALQDLDTVNGDWRTSGLNKLLETLQGLLMSSFTALRDLVEEMDGRLSIHFESTPAGEPYRGQVLWKCPWLGTGEVPWGATSDASSLQLLVLELSNTARQHLEDEKEKVQTY